MTRIEEIEQAIVSLPADEYNRFRSWFLDRDWEAWDRQVEADSAAGKLDFLAEEAEDEKRKGRLRSL